jgi:predicted PurR-regulated permease PerM
LVAFVLIRFFLVNFFVSGAVRVNPGAIPVLALHARICGAHGQESPPMNSPQRAVPVRDRFYARTFALVTALVLGIALFKIVQPFIGPLLWAMFIAFLLYPLHVWLSQRLKGRAQLSAALLTVLTLIVLLGPLAALSAAFAAQVGDLLQTVQSTVADQTRNNVFDLTKVPWVRDALSWLDGTFGINVAQVRGYIVEGSRTVLQTLASLGGKVFLGAFGAVFGFVLMVFMLFFFIRDGAGMVTTLRELIPMSRQQKTKLFNHLAAVTRALVYGTGLTALIQGTLVGISFLIVGLPSALVFGVIAALAALLPFGGTALVWIPAAIVLAAQGRWGATAFMVLWGTLLVSLVDNVVRPMLVAGRAPVSTLTVFIGVLGGIAAFGAIGLFLGPVVLALIIALMEFALEQRRAEEAKK